MPICQKCNQNFNGRIKIGNKTHTVHKRKYCTSCVPILSRQLMYQSYAERGVFFCRRCKKEKTVKEFHKHKGYCKSCINAYTKEQYRNFKQDCIDYKGGKCEICGYNKCIAALDFHHKDPKQKEFRISTLRISNFDKNKGRITSELDKCQLLCSNCHREVHFQIDDDGIEPSSGGL
jgi:hypothetical protein